MKKIIDCILKFLGLKKDRFVFKPNINTSNLMGIELDIVSRINYARMEEGLNSLIIDSLHYKVARDRNIDNIELGRITHDNRHESFRPLYEKELVVSENLGFGYTNSSSLVTSWLNSEGHRKTIMDPTWEFTAVRLTKDFNGKNYFCQIFSKNPPQF